MMACIPAAPKRLCRSRKEVGCLQEPNLRSWSLVFWIFADSFWSGPADLVTIAAAPTTVMPRFVTIPVYPHFEPWTTSHTDFGSATLVVPLCLIVFDLQWSYHLQWLFYVNKCHFGFNGD